MSKSKPWLNGLDVIYDDYDTDIGKQFGLKLIWVVLQVLVYAPSTKKNTLTACIDFNQAKS